MPETQGPDYEKQGRESLSSYLSKNAQATPLQTALAICQLISQSARTDKDPRRAIVDVCRGAMGAVFLGGRDVPETAVKILEALPNMSLMMRVGPEDMMTWVMEGIAGATPITGPGVSDRIAAKIDEKFMGAGAVFNAFCHQAREGSQK